jgi:hypothetical protein
VLSVDCWVRSGAGLLCGVWSVECGVLMVCCDECGVRYVEFLDFSFECRVRSVDC